MSVFIPTWLLWALGLLIGVPFAVALIVLSIFGALVAHSLKGGIWR